MTTELDLIAFDGSNGSRPFGDLYQDTSGNLYGTTLNGGANGDGAVFEIARDESSATGFSASPTLLASFSASGSGSGNFASGGLIADASGDLFGTTTGGGINSTGTVFEVVKDGSTATGYNSSPITLVTFDKRSASFTNANSTGVGPKGSLIADAAGNLYGTAVDGGAGGTGVVFEVAKTGTNTYANTPTVLASFATPDNNTNMSPNSTGSSPVGSLTMDATGNLYGTTSGGGTSADGTVFEIVKTGAGTYANSPTVLATFSSGSGSHPLGSLITDPAGDLFCTTSEGGSGGAGAIIEIVKNGANSYAGTPVEIASFTGASPDGAFPNGSLIADAAGNFYGTTESGGTTDGGTIFKITKTGMGSTGYSATPTILASLPDAGGNSPNASLVADAAGNLFGTASSSGSANNGNGTVFEITGSGFVTCFATGTQIRLSHEGCEVDVAVESLRVGDLAVTADGAKRPICWIGSRSIDPCCHPRPLEAHPVRIRAHAFVENRPARDLLVSPGHSLCVDVLGEVLIPASALVNGTTVVQEVVDSVTYWHVELDSHDIILAENLPCESYLEMGNRSFFAQSNIVDLAASPDAVVPTHADFCRPFFEDGPVVACARERLSKRAADIGWRLAHEPLADLHFDAKGRGVEARK